MFVSFLYISLPFVSSASGHEHVY